MNSATVDTLPNPFSEPVSAKELAPLIGRSVKWVTRKCHAGTIRTLPVGVPYRIPADEANRLAGLVTGAAVR